MPTSTPLLKLIKGAEGENYDLGITNDNLDKLDAGGTVITVASSTLSNAGWDFTQSRFTRIRFGTSGLILGQIRVKPKANFVFNDNPAVTSNAGDPLPAGFKLYENSGYYQAVGYGVGQNLTMQCNVGGGPIGSFNVRRDWAAGSASSAQKDVTYSFDFISLWNGVL